jgi:phage terminase small subunit
LTNGVVPRTIEAMANAKSPSAYGALPARRRVFVDAYLETGGRGRWNGTAAARVAGYAKPAEEAHRLLRNAQIREAIEERLAEYRLRANEVLARIEEQALGSMADFVSLKKNDAGQVVGVTLDLRKARRLGKLHLVKKLKEGEHGLEVELYSSQAALELLARAHGLLKDKVQVDANVGGLGELVEAVERLGGGGQG